MPRPKPLPDHLAVAPFSVADARAHGIPRARLRSSDLIAPFYGVRVGLAQLAGAATSGTASDGNAVNTRSTTAATTGTPSNGNVVDSRFSRAATSGTRRNSSGSSGTGRSRAAADGGPSGREPRGSGTTSPAFDDRPSPFATATEDTLRLARSYAARMSRDQYFSHTTAAALLGLRMPDGFLEPELHVSSSAPSRAPRCRGVVGHQAGSSIRPVTLPAGLRVTGPIDTWCQLGATAQLDNLVIMADGLVRRLKPLATPAQLGAAVDSRKGQRGARALRQALGLVRPGTDSARETMLRLIVVRAGFPEPEVNAPISNRFGARIAHADLAFRQYSTILEYDGGQHRDNEAQFHIDIDRLDELMEERWRVIRVNKALMARRATLLGKIRTALIAGGWTA